MKYSYNECTNCTNEKYTCGDVKNYAYCTYIDSDFLPEWSELKDENCVVTYETTKELYGEVGKIKDMLIFDKEQECFSYDTNDQGKVTIKEVIKKIIDKLDFCNTPSGSNAQGITYCDLDYNGLSKDDECNQNKRTLCEDLQLVFDILKELNDKVNAKQE